MPPGSPAYDATPRCCICSRNFRQQRAAEKHLPGRRWPSWRLDCGRDFCRHAEIDADDTGSPPVGDFGKSAHTAANIKNQFTREVLGTKSGAPAERLLGAATLFIIQLCPRVELPLETEAARVVLHAHEADYTVHLRENQPAMAAGQPFRVLFDHAAAGCTTKDG